MPVSIAWDRLPKQLDAIASLTVGDKLRVVDGVLEVDPPRMLRAASRFLRGDYGLESVVWVEYVILCSLERLRDRRLEDPQGTAQLAEQLCAAYSGLRKLSTTYRGDSAIGYKIASLQQLLASQLRDRPRRRQ